MRRIRTLHEDYSSEWQRKVKVPQKWVNRIVVSVQAVAAAYGKPSRIMHVGGAVIVAFRRGAELAVLCPHGVSEAYRVALEEALKQ